MNLRMSTRERKGESPPPGPDICSPPPGPAQSPPENCWFGPPALNPGPKGKSQFSGARWLGDDVSDFPTKNQRIEIPKSIQTSNWLSMYAGTVFQSTGNKDATFGQKAQTTGPC